MPLQATSQTIRLRADETSRSGLLDANTNGTPQAWARAATTFEIGLASGGDFVDVGNLASVTLEAAPYSNRDAARVLSGTVPAAQLANTLTEASWDDGSNQHALITFTAAQMNFLAAGTYSANYWIVISGLTTGGAPIVFGTGTLMVNDPGTFFSASTPPANPGVYATLDQLAALLNTTPPTWYPTVTSVGNGAPTSLEALVTATLTVPVLVTLYNVASDDLENWLLVASSAATNTAEGIQQPLDFNASTNAKVWIRK